ncbi:CASP-like protein 4A4 [Nymphaea thermarum]|nr:CASP-like protein 4A4 [Nymphaea thermarum]
MSVSMSNKNRAIGESERMEYGSFSGIYTPSPFPAESIASTTLSSRPTLLCLSNLVLRCFALLFCFFAALPLALRWQCSTFRGSSAYRSLLVSEKISDYTTFMLDQVVAYLLMSSSSTLVANATVATATVANATVMQHCGKLAAASAGMSFFAFFTIAMSALQSGYKLCKRIIW